MKLFILCLMLPFSVYSQELCNDKKMKIDGVYTEYDSSQTRPFILTVIDNKSNAIKGLEVKTSNTAGSWNLYSGETNEAGQLSFNVHISSSSTIQIRDTVNNLCIYLNVNALDDSIFERKITWK